MKPYYFVYCLAILTLLPFSKLKAQRSTSYEGTALTVKTDASYIANVKIDYTDSDGETQSKTFYDFEPIMKKTASSNIGEVSMVTVSVTIRTLYAWDKPKEICTTTFYPNFRSPDIIVDLNGDFNNPKCSITNPDEYDGY